MRTKKTYQQPETAVTQVELESPICSGSVDINNPSGNNFEIEDQKVNNDFGYKTPENDSWDN